MKIVLLQTGKTVEKYISDGVSDYSARINRFTGFEVITVPDIKNARNMSVNELITKEGRVQLQFLDKDDLVILLDRKGKQMSTPEFAGELEKMFMMPRKRLVFIIGGAWGVSEEVRRRANYIFSLSEMTFSHQVVRLLFMEQLYRVLTIIKGLPYHHE